MKIIPQKCISFVLILVMVLTLLPVINSKAVEVFVPEPDFDEQGSQVSVYSAQTSSAWNPTMPLPNRRLSPAEVNAWISLYSQRGGISHLENEVLRLANIERNKLGLAPLGTHTSLFMAGRFKSQEMIDLNYAGHVSPVYGSNVEIIRLFTNTSGFTFNTNLFVGSG